MYSYIQRALYSVFFRNTRERDPQGRREFLIGAASGLGQPSIAARRFRRMCQARPRDSILRYVK